MSNTATALEKIDNPSFNLPVLVSPEEAMEVIHQNLDNLGEMRFDKIKMPSGGGISFALIDENGKKTPLTELRGIILDKFPFKAWYIKSYDEKEKDDIGIPDCFSDDNVHGSGCPEAGIPKGQVCADCPKNQWGSDRRGGRGKDCAEKIRVHILLEDSVFPKYIDLPPTSITNFKEYVKRLSDKLNLYYGVVTIIGLEESENSGKTPFTRATFSKAANLSSTEKVKIRDYIKTLYPSMRKITRESIGEPISVNDTPMEPVADDGEPF